jgi:1-deoxy-D-xylulose-5-phosphate synthase
LGAVELAVALHFVYNTPTDQIIWDTGHQAYAHKILTGRKAQFRTNRLKGGISGFPKISESEYDSFGVGHSSTSISAALGMAVAATIKKDYNTCHIAVIGDGALSAGLAFEGLNNIASHPDANLLIIVNDNNQSIDASVGALKEMLNNLSTNSLLSNKNNLFKALLLNYFGPIDGNDSVALAYKLQELKTVKGPKILHCVTQKGSGYKYAEQGDPTQWHAPGKFDKNTGEIIVSNSHTPAKYQDVFGETIVELAQLNTNIVGVTPAMASGSSLDKMMQQFPERTFDVGIAEQHAVTFSAGLAKSGLLPFCCIYSTFLQRAYDQVIHDVLLQNLKVVFCIDRAGLVGADGATHHGVFDLAFLRILPNITIAAPMNERELRNLLYTAHLAEYQGALAIRYPRGKGVLAEWKQEFEAIEIGKGRLLTPGNDMAVLSIGHVGNIVQNTLKNVQDYSVAHYDMRFVKPLDEVLLHEIFTKFTKIITIEDGCVTGGFGSSILEFIASNSYTAQVKQLGIPDVFTHHGTQNELYSECNFDESALLLAILELGTH